MKYVFLIEKRFMTSYSRDIQLISLW